MTHTLSWHTPEKVLLLTLHGHINAHELDAINQAVIDKLDESASLLHILIDASEMVASYSSADYLRNTQKYMNHRLLDSAIVVSDNKLNRLVTLMAFCVARTKFFQCERMDKAERLLRSRGDI